MGRIASLAVLSGLTAALAVPGAALGTEVVTARPAPPNRWDLEASGSYAATNDFGGWGIAVRGGWLPVRYLVVGVGVETTRLHAEGSLPAEELLPARTYSQTFQSTFPAVFLRWQLPLRFITPYAEVATGFVVVHDQRAVNAQCSYGSGPGGGFAVGVDAQVVPSLAAGLRAGVRNTGWGGGCLAEGGPWSFQDDFRMTSLALTARFAF
jgi:hypothetical protein